MRSTAALSYRGQLPSGGSPPQDALLHDGAFAGFGFRLPRFVVTTPEGLAWVDARLSRRRARSRPGWVRQHKFTKHLRDGGFRRADKGRVPGDAQTCECACDEGRGSSGAGSIAWGNAHAREGTGARLGSYGDAAREIVWLGAASRERGERERTTCQRRDRFRRRTSSRCEPPPAENGGDRTYICSGCLDTQKGPGMID